MKAKCTFYRQWCFAEKFIISESVFYFVYFIRYYGRFGLVVHTGHRVPDEIMVLYI